MTTIDLFDEMRVEVDHGACVLRPVPFDRFGELVGMVGAGLFPDGDSTLGDWYDPQDLPRSARRTVAYHAGALADAGPDRWSLPLGVWVGDELVGVQSLDAEGFRVRREAATGSFLAPGWRGRGIGKLARHGVLAVAFGELAAAWVVSGALTGNDASKRVSLSAGYVPDGTDVIEQGGVRHLMERFRISREDWAARGDGAPTVRTSGFEAFASRIGVAR